MTLENPKLDWGWKLLRVQELNLEVNLGTKLNKLIMGEVIYDGENTYQNG